MSNILKGLNESNYRSYDANRTGFSRGPRDDERHDLDVQRPAQQQWALKINGKVWSKDGNAVTFNSKEQALKARQSLLAKRPELEVGLVTRNVAESYYDNGDYYTAKRGGEYGRNLTTTGTTGGGGGEVNRGVNNGQLGRPVHNKLAGVSKALPADPFNRTTGKIPAGKRGKVHSITSPGEEPLEEISNEKLAQYKTAAAADASKADKQGNYKRGDKRFSGIVKATKKQFANDEKKEVDEEKQRLDPKCWTGYKKQGTKMKGGVRVNNCVPVKETNSHILKGLQQVDEGWKEKLGAAALAGTMALGAAGANARVTPDGEGGFTGGLKPTATVTAPTPTRIDSPSGPSGFSKEYLQKAADPNRTGRYMISVEKAQELLKQGQ